MNSASVASNQSPGLLPQLAGRGRSKYLPRKGGNGQAQDSIETTCSTKKGVGLEGTLAWNGKTGRRVLLLGRIRFTEDDCCGESSAERRFEVE